MSGNPSVIFQLQFQSESVNLVMHPITDRSILIVCFMYSCSCCHAERDGRFVHRQASECGIHTRVSTIKKAPHGGGTLVNLLTKDSTATLRLGEHYDKTIELNERQVRDNKNIY